MDRLTQLAGELDTILDQLHAEAAERGLRQFNAPLAWLDEANRWLMYELTRLDSPDPEPVQFTFIPADFRR